MDGTAALPSSRRIRALVIERYGGPEVMRMDSDAPIPVPAAGQVLVRVVCAGINFMDVHTRQGKYARSRTYPVRLPCTLGMEGAGVVVEAGAGVKHLRPGQRIAWCIAWGSFAEFACIPAHLAAVLPDGIAFDTAAAAMFHGCTAHYLVNDVARLHAGSRCLIHAASGGIGQILVQMAKRLGAKVYATASTEAKRQIAYARGADEVFAYGNGAFADAVRRSNGGNGVDVVFDSVGKDTLRGSFRATRTQGLVVNYGNVSGSVMDLDPYELGEAGSLFLTRPRLADHMRDAATVQRRADDVFSAILDGTLRLEIAGQHAFADIAIGLERIESRQQVGKAVVWI